jgi:hypothetical protein
VTDYPEEEFAPIAKAMKDLPYFAPSPQFADKVMARVRVPGAVQVPAVSDRRAVEPVPMWSAPIERRSPAPVPQTSYRRSIPARIAAAALVASVGVTMTAVALIAIFDVNLFVLVSRIFGQGTVSFLASLASDASASATATVSSGTAAAGTVTGMAVIGSFAAGAVAATAALRAAATASRKAA